jgi:GTP diphosphokinase / guanosine-3',5'-bis(diphosphate) 3'-diphosphatase
MRRLRGCIDGDISHPLVLAGSCASRTIEDTETTEEELCTTFGDEIAQIVVEMTDDKSLPKEERKRLQIEHTHRMSREGALVKLADKICNLRDVAANPPLGWNLERQVEYFDWAKAVVDGLPRVSEYLLTKFDGAYAARPRI